MRARSGQARWGVRTNQSKWLVLALVALLAFWMVCFVALSTTWLHKSIKSELGNDPDHHSESVKVANEVPLKPRNLSRSGKVIATSDVRGNLGPASVVVQQHPGKDWIHDRWQAASNMHGKNIPGAHWILLDFGERIIPDKIVLDWEAAYSDMYRIEASLEPISATSSPEEIWTVFDSTDEEQRKLMSVEEEGQSPGVQTKTPLHVIHTLHPSSNQRPLRYLRLYILKSNMGWGVSLWQFDVYGFYSNEITLWSDIFPKPSRYVGTLF